MDHGSHQNKVLALGIALLLATLFILLSMHDADAQPDGRRLLRVRDAPASEIAPIAPRADGDAAKRIDKKRTSTLDNR
jgi:hypothetical protein